MRNLTTAGESQPELDNSAQSGRRMPQIRRLLAIWPGGDGYVQTSRLKAVAVVFVRLINFRPPCANKIARGLS